MVLVAVVAANRDVFSVPVHEHSDYAANSLLIDRATRLQLSTGQYSRFGWYHPGPALLYVQAAGQRLFSDWAPLAASPYGGQLLGVVVLNAALVGVVLRIAGRWFRSGWALAAGVGVVLGFAAANPGVLTNGWAPFTWVVQALLLVVASASVLAAPRPARDLWAVVLAGGLLVHGHLGFVVAAAPVAAVVVAVALAAGRTAPGVAAPPDRHAPPDPTAAVRRRSLGWAAGVAGVLALAPVAHVLASWPGELGRWWQHVRTGGGGAHGPLDALGFVGRFWLRGLDDGRVVWVVLLLGAALAAAAVDADPVRRRAVRLALATTAGLGALGWLYAWQGVDDLALEYLGVYLVAAPWALLLVVAMRLGDELAARGRAGATAAAAGLAAAGVLVALAAPGLRDHYRGQPLLPQMVEAVAGAGGLAPGAAVVVDFEPVAWNDALGLLVAVERRGGSACLLDAQWRYMVANRGICTPAEVAGGWHVRLSSPARVEGTVLWSSPAVVLARPDGPAGAGAPTVQS